ncbi:hypothetical protein TNCV_260501 [Trichonephila clavipes]|nr:hypothetical protein TNCV_260501 [Trichonephila clavipes]
MLSRICAMAYGVERSLNSAEPSDMTAYETICIEPKLYLPRYALCATLESSWTPHILYTVLFITRRCSPSVTRRLDIIMNSVSAFPPFLLAVTVHILPLEMKKYKFIIITSGSL